MNKFASIFILTSALTLISCSPKIAVKKNEIVYYTCPMHSEIFQTKPGHCPKCLMELVEWDPKSKPYGVSDGSHSGHSDGGGHSGHSGGGHNH